MKKLLSREEARKVWNAFQTVGKSKKRLDYIPKFWANDTPVNKTAKWVRIASIFIARRKPKQINLAALSALPSWLTLQFFSFNTT